MRLKFDDNVLNKRNEFITQVKVISSFYTVMFPTKGDGKSGGDILAYLYHYI